MSYSDDVYIDENSNALIIHSLKENSCIPTFNGAKCCSMFTGDFELTTKYQICFKVSLNETRNTICYNIIIGEKEPKEKHIAIIESYQDYDGRFDTNFSEKRFKEVIIKLIDSISNNPQLASMFEKPVEYRISIQRDMAPRLRLFFDYVSVYLYLINS